MLRQVIAMTIIVSEFFNAMGLTYFAIKNLSYVFQNITTLDDLRA